MDVYRNDRVTMPSFWSSMNVTDSVMSPAVTDVASSARNQTADQGSGTVDPEKQRIIVIAVLMALTLIGNMTLILVIMCKRSRRIKRVNILLMNLAVGDLFVALCVNSTEILFLAFGDWNLGEAICKISVYVQMICLSSATNLLTAMSIDRYQVIVKPMQSLAKRPRIWLKITIAWTLSLIFPLPHLFIFVQYNSGLKYDGSARRICGSRGYTAPWQRKVYLTYTTLYILVVPMLIMLYCYTKIIRVVWVRAEHETRRRSSCLVPRPADLAPVTRTATRTSDTSREVCSSNENSDAGCGCDGSVKKSSSRSSKTVRWSRKVTESHHIVESASGQKNNNRELTKEDLNSGSPRMSIRRGLVTASKRRALVMTLTVVVSFLVCHTPYFFITLVRIYSDYQLKLERAMFVSESLVMVHSTLNPLLYGLFTLRQYHLKHIVSSLTCSAHPQQQHGQHLRQYSHDRTQLLTNVRSKLGNINSSTTTTTTTTFISNCNNTHSDPLLGHIKTARTKHLSIDHPFTTPPLPTLMKKAVPKPTPRCIDHLKHHSHTLDTDLILNKEASCLTDQQMTKVANKDQSEVDPSVATCPDLFPPYSFINDAQMLPQTVHVSPSGAGLPSHSQATPRWPADDIVRSQSQDMTDQTRHTVNMVSRPTKMEDTWAEGFNRD